MHLAAAHGWSQGQDNITGAFLHSEINTEIYIKQLPGFEDRTNHVLKLLLGLYGLKQALQLWNDHMDAKLIGIGYHWCKSDNAVYVCWSKSGDTILAIHIDNFLSFASSDSKLIHSQTELHQLFEMTTENPNWIMGFEIIKNLNQGTVEISHYQYINIILEHFNLVDCNTYWTPMETETVLSTSDTPSLQEGLDKMKKIPYQEATGALVWISIILCSDIAFTVLHLAQFNSNPGCVHWYAAKWVLCYLAATQDLCLILGLEAETTKMPVTTDHTSPTLAQILSGYLDSDWRHDTNDRQSVFRYVFCIRGSTIAWNSWKQATVAASLTGAKYMALAYASKQRIWL